jgi:Fe-S-cluster containining protein
VLYSHDFESGSSSITAGIAPNQLSLTSNTDFPGAKTLISLLNNTFSGDLGRKRAGFCQQFIRQKQTVFKEIQREIANRAASRGKKISCRKGCSFCCSLYVEASIKECEAIVYYLYLNAGLLASFLRRFAIWREKMSEAGDIFLQCLIALEEMRDVRYLHTPRQSLEELLQAYKKLNIPCPFLDRQECTIYEVRPYTCAIHCATSPAELCKPESLSPPELCKTMLPEEIFDLSFYCGELRDPGISLMAVTVYEIISGGYLYLSRVTGIRALAELAETAGEHSC